MYKQQKWLLVTGVQIWDLQNSKKSVVICMKIWKNVTFLSTCIIISVRYLSIPKIFLSICIIIFDIYSILNDEGCICRNSSLHTLVYLVNIFSTSYQSHLSPHRNMIFVTSLILPKILLTVSHILGFYTALGYNISIKHHKNAIFT